MSNYLAVKPDRKALVTGGASGFGFAIARALADAGARVALLDADEDQLDRSVSQLDGGTIGLRADVTSSAEVRRAVDAVGARLGGLDTLVVSAGVIHYDALAEVTEADWDHTLAVNLKGAFLVIQAAEPLLRESGRGRVVTISSDAGRRGAPYIAAYTASKFGLVGLTESLAAELATDGITVNCVCPVGCPGTDMGEAVLAWKVERSGRTPDQVLAGAAALNAVGRNAAVDDVVTSVMFFLAESASFLTGVSLDVDGGAHLGVVPGGPGPGQKE
jgi:meso-butanediol dehydrogenase/(S,S)-butanediol dehydrogenase/diacetyl reductase